MVTTDDVRCFELPWFELAHIDGKLVRECFPDIDVSAHIIHEQSAISFQGNLIQDYLTGIYKDFLAYFEVKPVRYLTGFVSNPLGVFAKTDIEEKVMLPSLTGFLSKMNIEDIIAGKNDFSLIRKNENKQDWLMLGPISFVNHSCAPNGKYVRKNNIMYCESLRKILAGEEILVFYNNHFFGEFNENCLCGLSEKHFDPCPPSPEPKSKKRCTKRVRHKLTHIDLSSRYAIVDRYFENSSSESETETYSSPSKVSTDESFSDNSCDLSEAKTADFTNSQSTPERPSDVDDNLIEAYNAVADVIFMSPPNLVSTPVSLHEYETNSFCNFFDDYDENLSEESTSEQGHETELYIDSSITSQKFFYNFDSVCDLHKLSDNARADILKLFSKTLPQPNCVLDKRETNHLPLIWELEDPKGDVVLNIDLIDQLKRIVNKNQKYIKSSWEQHCNWYNSKIKIQYGEIFLVLSFDGATVFKSRNLSIWPVWVQILNLPPKLRSAIGNISLLAIWHGNGKPDFRFFLKNVVQNLESFLGQKFDLENVGEVKFLAKCLVADMPATASCLFMKEHMGYYSCGFCFMRGIRHNHRTLFPAKAPLLPRTSISFRDCAEKSEHKNKDIFGVKGFSPLNSIFCFPWDAPIDPMHQIFLGTARMICQLLKSLLPYSKISVAEQRIFQCKVPLDFLHRPKSLNEMINWKAADYKLFFFHIAPLVFTTSLISKKFTHILVNFRRLVVAIRLLSNFETTDADIESAKKLLDKFFENFVRCFTLNSQSYNFHCMRHLPEQVEKLGPLWLYSAFPFESAHRELLNSTWGTVKNIRKMVERFFTRQKNLGNRRNKNDYMVDSLNLSAQDLKRFTLVEEGLQFFDSQINTETFQGRYKSLNGTIFASLSYSRLRENFGECIVQTQNEQFAVIEVFFVKNSVFFALVRYFLDVIELNISDEETSCAFFYQIERLSNLQAIPVNDIKFKCVVIENAQRNFLQVGQHV